MSTAIATREPQTALAARELTTAQVDLIRKSIMPGATDDELQYFIGLCNNTGLNPFRKQIYAVKRKQNIDGKWLEKFEAQIGIDGVRVLAERTGLYDGQTPPQWCNKKGEWFDVWIFDEPPVAARVTVFKKGIAHPFQGMALYREFVQTKADGSPTKFWAQMPANQLAKCAEAQAFRKACFELRDIEHLEVRISDVEETWVDEDQSLLRKPEGALPPAELDAAAELAKAQEDYERANSATLKDDAKKRIDKFTKKLATEAQAPAKDPGAGLDKWACKDRALAMAIIDARKQLLGKGWTAESLREDLAKLEFRNPDGTVYGYDETTKPTEFDLAEAQFYFAHLQDLLAN